MELSSFSENIVTERFERGGEALMLQINIDAILPGYFDELENRFLAIEKRVIKASKKKTSKVGNVFQSEKRSLELQREAYAEMLTCPVKLSDGSATSFLVGWDLTENGMPLAASKEVLCRMPPRAVKELWEFCKAKAATVKKRVDEETEETSESTHSGSRAALALAPTG